MRKDDMEDKKGKGAEEKNLVNAAIAGASAERVQRYGSAVKEHIVAYSGIDNENGIRLKKSLKTISESKVNPDYKAQNLKQQAGFSAEVKEAANANAENIIKGSKNRKVRTDDLGKVNDPLFDFVEIDGKGDIIPGSGIQMKFVGSNPKEALNKLASAKFSKYLDNNAKIEVPSDYYDGIMEEADKAIEKLQKQIENQRSAGNGERAEQLQERLDRYKKIRENLKKSTVSNEDAMLARKYPKLSAAKSIAGVAHRAGVASAKTGAVIGSSVSIVKNLVALVKEEKDAGEAVSDVARDTMSAAAAGYGTGFAGAAVKGWMQNAGRYARNLSKTNLPGTMVTVTLSVGKIMGRYFTGDIDGVTCFEELGEQGVGMLSSSLFAAIGQAAIPIPVVGGLIGGMAGYAIASASYGILKDALREEKIAQEERVAIERECDEYVKLIREYRAEMEAIISEYLTTNMAVFHEAFYEMKASLNIGDADGFISGANAISRQLGRPPGFSNFEEFEQLMGKDSIIRI